MINPLGFTLEQFDAVGRFRTTEHDQAIDTVSDYMTDDGEKIHLAGPADIANYAIASDQAHDTFIEQMFHHLVKQPIAAYGPDTPTRLRRSFVDSGFNMQKLAINIAVIAASHGLDRSNS